jgi:hypothetical protein
MTDKLTIDNVVGFYQKVQLGQTPRYWKSAPIPSSSPEDRSIDQVVALNALDYISNGWSALGFYDRDNGSLSGMMEAKEYINSKCRIGSFDLGNNEWPGKPITFQELPRVVLFNDGVVRVNVPLETSPKAVVAQILHELNERDL